MEASEQANLVREFMLAIAPEIVRSQLTLIRRYMASTIMDEGELAELQSKASVTIGRLSLEWAMHLAGCYAGLYDEAVSPPTQEAVLAKAFRAQEQKQPPGRPAPRVQPAKDDVSA